LIGEFETHFQTVVDLGLASCQVCSWDPAVWTDATAQRLTAEAGSRGIRVTTFWAGWPGPAVWNFVDGPKTIGLVPPAHRAARVAVLKQAATFAAKCQLPSVTTHVGFLPEDPNDPQFEGTVVAVREVASCCGDQGLGFWFETGQETPVTLLRTIERVSAGNLGVNFDTANVILYGKANPVDALDVIGSYVRGVHAKDGLYPTDGTSLGREVPLGEGKVDFPALVGKLKSIGYTGALTIEREIAGQQQRIDVTRAIELLRPLC
jgi:sugar phosphate isomerase/epimerase